MKKITYRIIILSIIVFVSLTIYLSTIGIKTDKFNNRILEQVQNIDKNLKVELKKISIVLDPFKLKLFVETIGANIIYNDKKIGLEKIKSNISLKSFINNDFFIGNLQINTKSLDVKKLISFIRLFKNDAKLFIAEKLIKNGYIIANIDLEFNRDGKFKDNYKIKGLVKDGSINFLKKYNLKEIDFSFKLDNKKISLKDLNLFINNYNVSVPQITAEKINEKFFVSGKVKNKNIILDEKTIREFVDYKILGLPIKEVNFDSSSSFNFNIDKRLRFKDLSINSKINLGNLVLSNNINLKDILPKIQKEIKFKNHKIDLIYEKEILKVEGIGGLLFQENEDKINYKIFKKKQNLKFDAKYEISNNELKFDFLNYSKKKKTNLEINLKGNKTFNKDLIIEKISLNEERNYLNITNLSISNDGKIDKFDKIDLNYLDNRDLKNKIQIFRSKKIYNLKGDSFNIDKIIENLLNISEKKKLLFKNDFNLNVNVKEVFLDELNTIKNLNGYLFIQNNDISEAELDAKFENRDKITFTVKKNGNEKITTLFSSKAKPFVKRYKFIKGFDDGSLDFYSIKKNTKTTSTLKIYDFKLKELPALTKILTLASLQGIADLLSGEGIRFNEFEMNYSNKDNLMTIDEIYSIGPAISVLMSGYVEKDKLISLRGTLVPATTLNKTIGSIPFLGDILVGKKTGEGVFGVSFKIKGPPKKTETTVNPIKTLTPRFITRTLEKIKNN